MKKPIYLILSMLLTLGIVSCSDDNIGSSIADTQSSIIEDSSFIMTGKSVQNTRLHARTSTQLLGSIYSKNYGHLSSDVVTQLMPANVIDTTGFMGIDSCRYTMCVAANSNKAFTGDSLVPMRLSIYALNKQLPNEIYSDFDPSGYYSAGDLLASASYSAQSAVPGYSYSGSAKSLWREVRVPMPASYAQRIYDLYKSDPKALSNPDTFKQHFPGLYIANSFGTGRVMNYYSCELEVFYRKSVTIREGTDSIYHLSQSYVGCTPEVIINNNIKLTPDDNIKQMVDKGDAVVMGPAGYEVEVDFPIQEIIDTYNRNTAEGLSLINSMELNIPAEAIENQYGIAPPEYLLMVKKGKKDEFFAGDSLTNSEDSFYAQYNSSKKCYTFTGLRKYVLNIINKQHGVATADDIHLTLTPIDVSIYTNKSIYGKPSTTVTKIAPSVSKPTLCRIRLDQAKIKIVYAEETML